MNSCIGSKNIVGEIFKLKVLVRCEGSEVAKPKNEKIETIGSLKCWNY